MGIGYLAAGQIKGSSTIQYIKNPSKCSLDKREKPLRTELISAPSGN